MAMFAWDPCGVELAHSLCLSPTSEQGSYRGMLSKLFLIKHEECPAAKPNSNRKSNKLVVQMELRTNRSINNWLTPRSLLKSWKNTTLQNPVSLVLSRIALASQEEIAGYDAALMQKPVTVAMVEWIWLLDYPWKWPITFQDMMILFDGVILGIWYGREVLGSAICINIAHLKDLIRDRDWSLIRFLPHMQVGRLEWLGCLQRHLLLGPVLFVGTPWKGVSLRSEHIVWFSV